MSKGPIARPKTRWEDEIFEDIKNMNVRDWKKVAQNRDSCKKVVEQARNLYRSHQRDDTVTAGAGVGGQRDIARPHLLRP
jgi:hypothetical protein